MTGVQPLSWLRLLRDDPEVGGYRLAVLAALALRVSGVTGSGHCSYARAALDAGCSDAVAKRAIRWAIGRGYLRQISRGHRLGNGESVASVYELTGAQQVSGDLLSATSTGLSDNLNRSLTPSQQVSGDPLRESLQGVNTHKGEPTVVGELVVESFDEFWEVYPRKIGRSAARKEWTIAVERADASVVLAAAVRQRSSWEESGTESRFIPHPARWLSEARYEDGFDSGPVSNPLADNWMNAGRR